jgi:hypothetical protein
MLFEDASKHALGYNTYFVNLRHFVPNFNDWWCSSKFLLKSAHLNCDSPPACFNNKAAAAGPAAEGRGPGEHHQSRHQPGPTAKEERWDTELRRWSHDTTCKCVKRRPHTTADMTHLRVAVKSVAVNMVQVVATKNPKTATWVALEADRRPMFCSVPPLHHYRCLMPHQQVLCRGKIT